MNQELKEKAGAVLLELLQDFTKAKEFAIEQAPEVVVELLNWHFYKSIMWSSLGVVLMLGAFVMFLIWIKFACKPSPDFLPDEKEGPFGVILVFLSIGMTVCYANSDWLQILIAPKLYLIEYVRGF